MLAWWDLLLVANVAASSLAVGWTGVKAWEFVRARRVRSKLGEPAGNLDAHVGELVTIDGTLAVDDGIASFHPTGKTGLDEAHIWADTPEARAFVRVGERLVRLEPPLQVLVGSRERREKKGHRRTVHAGDRVRVRGKLALEASGSPTQYRDQAAAFRLSPPPDAAWARRPIPIAARVPVRARSVAIHTLVILLSVWSAVFWDAVLSAGVDGPPRRPACAAQIDSLLAESDPWSAQAKLASCKDPIGRARTAWLLADFTGASDAFRDAFAQDASLEPSVTEAQAHALAGRDDLAQATIRRMADRWYKVAGSREKNQLMCLSDAYGKRAGDVQASIRITSNLGYGSACDLLRADFKGGEAYCGGRSDWDPWENLVLAASSPWTSKCGPPPFALGAHDSPQGIRDPRALLHLRPIALDKATLDALKGELEPRDEVWRGDELAVYKDALASYAAELALFYAYMGERKDALATLDLIPKLTATPPVDEHHEYRRAQVYSLGAVAALHARDLDRVRALMQYAQKHAHAVHLVEVYSRLLSPDSPPDYPTEMSWSPDSDLFLAARGGDGAEVARVLDEHRWTGRQALAFIVPHLTKNKDALGRFARERFPAPCWTCGIFALAETVSDRRELARDLGDRELEAKLAPVAHKLTMALTTRSGFVPLVLLEQFKEDGHLP